jgi:hypothetical protein
MANVKILKIVAKNCSFFSTKELFLVVAISLFVGILDFVLGFATALLFFP